MKKHLLRLTFSLCMGGMAWASQAQETGIKLPLPAGVTPRSFNPSAARDLIPCGVDTLAYPYLKELVFAAPSDSFFTDAMVGNVRAVSQAYLNNSPLEVLGVQFWGAAYTPGTAPQTLPVRVYLYEIDANHMPVGILDSATVTITEQYDYYEALFAAPHAHGGNFAVGVRSVPPNDTLAIITNNAGNGWSPNYGESLAWRRFGSGVWNSSLSFFGQDLEYMVFPIVRYNLETQLTTAAPTVCRGEQVTFNNASSALYGNRFVNLHAFDEYWNFTAADSTFSFHAGEGADVWGTATFTHTYNTAGSYQAVLTGELLGYYGTCTSTDTVSLTVNPTYSETDTVLVCQGDTLAFGTQQLTAAGVYTEVFTSALGCDSTVVLTLMLNPTLTGSQTASICQGDTFTFGSQSLTAPGTYTEVFSATGTGCDSTVTLTLSLIPTQTGTASVAICQGGTYTFGTQTLSAAGTYTEVFASAAGCDSTVSLTLTVTHTEAAATATGATLEATPAGGTYQWINCADNGPISGATGQTYTATANGSYAVVVTANNCADTSACVQVSTLSVADLGAGGTPVTLYPNPTDGHFMVDAHGTVAERIRMVDATGKLLLDVQPTASITSIPTEGLAQALYFVYVSVEGRTQVFKLLKK